MAEESVLEVAVVNNRVQPAQPFGLLLAVHLDLEKRFAARYPIAGVREFVFRHPPATTAEFTQGTRTPKRVRVEFTVGGLGLRDKLCMALLARACIGESEK